MTYTYDHYEHRYKITYPEESHREYEENYFKHENEDENEDEDEDEDEDEEDWLECSSNEILKLQ